MKHFDCIFTVMLLIIIVVAYEAWPHLERLFWI